MTYQRGFWGMHCWNALSEEQQEFLRTEGYLPIFTQPQGVCRSGAEVEITTQWDEFPGPRFYCRMCGMRYLRDTIFPTDVVVSAHQW